MLKWWKEGDEQREVSIQEFYALSGFYPKTKLSSNPCGNDIHEPQTVRCCNRAFCRFFDYEAHYELQHHYHCESCHNYWINERLLSIHVTEQHDPFFQLQKEREGELFHGHICFLTSCKKRFNSKKSRKRHMIDAHRFPSDFPFYFVDTMSRKAQGES